MRFWCKRSGSRRIAQDAFKKTTDLIVVSNCSPDNRIINWKGLPFCLSLLMPLLLIATTLSLLSCLYLVAILLKSE